MPPDAGDDRIVGTDRDKRIPRNEVIGWAPWRAQPLCQFRGEADTRIFSPLSSPTQRPHITGNAIGAVLIATASKTMAALSKQMYLVCDGDLVELH